MVSKALDRVELQTILQQEQRQQMVFQNREKYLVSKTMIGRRILQIGQITIRSLKDKRSFSFNRARNWVESNSTLVSFFMYRRKRPIVQMVNT